ncbi:hypothetical protein ACFZA1_42205 [Streptomyces filipinensis]|uniref:hypothetical protein n=1 Tax=Streptomyces filipinensis TaxID=66887 RepID=UPI0036ECC59C
MGLVIRCHKAATVDPRFENGPLAVVDVDEDGHVLAYCVGGLVLEVPAKSPPSLIERTLAEAWLGQARLHRNGRDADPVLVLTPAALMTPRHRGRHGPGADDRCAADPCREGPGTGGFKQTFNTDALTACTTWWSARSPTNARSSRASSPGTTCVLRPRC